MLYHHFYDITTHGCPIDAMNPNFRTHLRLVELEDARVICELRGNPALGRYLNPTVCDVKTQEEWILSYKHREAAGTEYYFVIVSDNCDQGLVRLYDFRDVEG